MLGQAAGLAILAAVSPTALLITAVYLGSARPRLAAAGYLAGALTMSIIAGLAVLAALRSLGLSRPAEHVPRYGLRVGTGVFLIGAALLVARWRRSRPARPARPARPGLVATLAARPGWRSAFAVGVLVFAPGATFIAAIEVIATARASIPLTVLATVLVVVINAMLVWLPILLYLARPEATRRRLAAFNVWLRAHGRMLLAGAMAIAGALFLGTGLLGLLRG